MDLSFGRNRRLPRAGERWHESFQKGGKIFTKIDTKFSCGFLRHEIRKNTKTRFRISYFFVFFVFFRIFRDNFAIFVPFHATARA